MNLLGIVGVHELDFRTRAFAALMADSPGPTWKWGEHIVFSGFINERPVGQIISDDEFANILNYRSAERAKLIAKTRDSVQAFLERLIETRPGTRRDNDFLTIYLRTANDRAAHWHFDDTWERTVTTLHGPGTEFFPQTSFTISDKMSDRDYKDGVESTIREIEMSTGMDSFVSSRPGEVILTGKNRQSMLHRSPLAEEPRLVVVIDRRPEEWAKENLYRLPKAKTG